MAAALALISAFFYSMAIVTARIGLKTMDTFSGMFISLGFSFIGSLVLFIFFVPINHFVGWGLFYFIIAGLSGPCIGRLMLFIGINRLGSSTASTLYSIKPLFSAIAAVLILGESMTFGIAIATVIMVIGLAVISSKENGDRIQIPRLKKDLIFPIAAGAAFGLGHVFRKVGLNINPDPLVGVVVQNVAALSFSLMPALLRKNQQEIVWKNLRAWIAFGLSGILSVLGQLTLFQALKIGSVIIVSPLSATSPLFVIVIALIFLKQFENITWKTITGALLIFLGTVLLTLFPLF